MSPSLPPTSTDNPGGLVLDQFPGNYSLVNVAGSDHDFYDKHHRRPVRLVDSQEYRRPGGVQCRYPTCWNDPAVRAWNRWGIFVRSPPFELTA